MTFSSTPAASRVRPTHLLLGLLVALLLGSGCDVTNENEFTPEYVVESYLFALDTLPDVRLSRTVPFGTAYVFEDQAVGNAVVTLHRLDTTGTLEATYRYQPVRRGIYRAPATADRVEPLHRYALEITFPDDDTVVRSETVVPDTFAIVASTADTLDYLGAEQFEITVTPSEVPGRQAVFVFSIEAAEPVFDNLVPFWLDIFDPDEDDREEFLADLRIAESPPFNEENYDRHPDGTLTVKLPWIAVNFYGENRVTGNTLDDNIFNYITSQVLQGGGSTLSPGEIPNVIDPIEGGTGLFGSYAKVTRTVFIRRPGQ